MINKDERRCGYDKCNHILTGRSDQQFCCRKHKNTVSKQRIRKQKKQHIL